MVRVLGFTLAVVLVAFSTGALTQANQECIDEAGVDFFVRDRAYIPGSSTNGGTDFCQDDSVVEIICVDDPEEPHTNSISLRCPHGCEYGACIGPDDRLCRDNEVKKNMSFAGSIDIHNANGDLLKTVPDVCFDYEETTKSYPPECYDDSGTKGNGKCVVEYTCNEEATNDDDWIHHDVYMCLHGCTDGACIRVGVDTGATCEDSDGTDIFTAGSTVRTFTTGAQKTLTDYCYENGDVAEITCNGSGDFDSIRYACPAGCSNGKCIGTDTRQCTDTEGVKPNLKKRGVVTLVGSDGSTSSHPDICFDFEELNNVYPQECYDESKLRGNGRCIIERSCDGHALHQNAYECPYGCKDGVCLGKTGKVDCIDPHDIDFYTAESLRMEYANGVVTEYKDSCKRGGVIAEQYCHFDANDITDLDPSGYSVREKYFACPNGCEDGQCRGSDTRQCKHSEHNHFDRFQYGTFKERMSFRTPAHRYTPVDSFYRTSELAQTYRDIYDALGNLVRTDHSTCFDFAEDTGSLYPSYCYDATGKKGNGFCVIDPICHNDGNTPLDFPVYCSNGCREGACVDRSSVASCSDPDNRTSVIRSGGSRWNSGTANQYIQSAITITYHDGTTRSAEDLCYSDTMLAEAECGSGRKFLTCKCTNGACAMPPKAKIIQCTDTDYAASYRYEDYFYIKGVISSGDETYEDHCLEGGALLKEYYCNDLGWIMHNVRSCIFGCYDGACIRDRQTAYELEDEIAAMRKKWREEQQDKYEKEVAFLREKAQFEQGQKKSNMDLIWEKYEQAKQRENALSTTQVQKPEITALQRNPSQFQVRVCRRVARRFSGNAVLIQRVNRRLESRFGFRCS